MRKIFFTGIIIILFAGSRCGKPSDYYSAGFLNEAEIAKPGMVDSLLLSPGRNRAQLSFNVGPDRRVNKLRVSYNSSLSAAVTGLLVDIGAQDYGNRKEVILTDLPEATLIVNIVSYDTKGDSSNTVRGSGFIYGNRYISSLYNRIYQGITTVNNIKRINLQNESGKPRDTTVFYTLQKTVIQYPMATGGVATIEVSPFVNEVPVPNIAATGTITHYSTFKPVASAIDVFESTRVTVNF